MNDSLGFYKKLSEPKRNEFVKRVMFENYSSQTTLPHHKRKKIRVHQNKKEYI
jgi:hypothetical protein